MSEKCYKVTQKQLIDLAHKSYTAGFFDSETESGAGEKEHIEAKVAFEACLSNPINEE